MTVSTEWEVMNHEINIKTFYLIGTLLMTVFTQRTNMIHGINMKVLIITRIIKHIKGIHHVLLNPQEIVMLREIVIPPS